MTNQGTESRTLSTFGRTCGRLSAFRRPGLRGRGWRRRLTTMRSSEIRTLLRRQAPSQRDTRRVHELGRAYARERLHLDTRPRRPDSTRDLLWAEDATSYKVVTRTVGSSDEAATIEVSTSSAADFLLLVLVDRTTFGLLRMARVTWSMVEWLGRPHGRRWRLRWSEDAPVRGVAELL